MTLPKSAATHPGDGIRKALPKGMSVKKAAELLGVGRPALSNLINGNAALTPEMAMRLEKAFGIVSQDLLKIQAEFDDFQRREKSKEIAVRSYVQSFLAIEARQISAWSEQIHARAELPALLRRLVHSTGLSLARVDFPAFDNSQRAGWDGAISADIATPWIPRGESGWEFGCNKDVKQKADDDYEARTTSIAPEERDSTTFVFITPRNWPAKNTWAESKQQSGGWKAVRAYDASDLEQWLEQSVSTQAWFAERLGIDVDGATTLDACWKEWADASEPPLSKTLFRTSVETARDKLQAWLSEPPLKPFIITADSETEALAFVSCALEALGKSPGEFYDRTLVLKTTVSLRRTTTGTPDFVAIVTSPEIEHASAGIQRTHHLMIIRRRNTDHGEPDVSLDLVDDKSFRDALSEMGLPSEEFDRYARESGHSPTILRRRLSQIHAIRQPAWSTDQALARKLIPLTFAGVWNSDSVADREIMGLLAHAPYSDIEQTVTELRIAPDAPVWSVGRFRGVASKIDVLFAAHYLLTKQELDDFFVIAELVLSESDPALDLPEEQRWAANIYGKTREHSGALRKGICETLVLLAVHGNVLFQQRLGIDVQDRVDGVVRKLLMPLDVSTWASQKGDLPHYAEAAPDVFLRILEQDLEDATPKVYALLRPANTMPFGSCPRTGLLWALETLAWKPNRLFRISSILAKLAAVHIEDNWLNKPEGSLGAIYRCWMPQTAASIEERNDALTALCRSYPDVGWRLCIAQFGSRDGVGYYSARPHWRNDALGVGQPVKTYGEVWSVADKSRDLALGWPNHNEQTLGDLVERVQDMVEPDQEKVWTLISAWNAAGPSDAAKHLLRERVRKFAFTRRARIHGVPTTIRGRAREVYAALAPADLLVRHQWLFAQHWVDESADEYEEEGFDYLKREARIAALRNEALTEIWGAAGDGGIIRLCELGNADSAIGWQLADGVIPLAEQGAFLWRLASRAEPPAALKIDNLLSGFLGRLDAETRMETLADLLERCRPVGAADIAIRLLKCSPFRAETWALLDTIPAEWRQRYWREAYVRWEGQDDREITMLVDRLLEAERPRAAFSAVCVDFKKIDTERLIKMLRAVAASVTEPAEQLQLSPYEISEAFKSLQERSTIARDELAQLEFMYFSALDHSDYGIPTLEAALADDPNLFMYLVALVYRRKDDEQDPSELSILDEKRRQATATTCYSILHRTRRTPGTNKDGVIDPVALRKWIEEVRALAIVHGRSETTDHIIGELLGRCAGGADGIWPCESVCQVLDHFASQDMAEGASIGRYNSRGVQVRREGGSDERGLAAQYRGWSKALLFQYPFTAKLLEDIARSYDREAVWNDTDANVRKRLTY